MNLKKAVILYNELSENAGPDEKDVIDQVNLVSSMLDKLKIENTPLEFCLNLQKVERELNSIKPDFVFNLVESVNNKGNLIFLAPALLTSMGIPFTGGTLETIFITSAKTLAKEKMDAEGIPTSSWFQTKNGFNPAEGKRYIVKPIWEDGSLGIDEDSVFSWNDPKLARVAGTLNAKTHFIEEFIDGREFNLSMLAGEDGPTILPPAEIVFQNYSGDKPKVLGYKAKWVEDSFEYDNTLRTFDFRPDEAELLDRLRDIAYRCWNVFRLNGYARVDFRVDAQGNPFVLEINVNPCISPDSGYFAACKQAGLPFEQAIQRIVNDAH
jgi:D-alanine-D-alanine ligase